jgi:hypothetical protein
MKFTTGVTSHGFGGLQVPKSYIWKLQKQERWWWKGVKSKDLKREGEVAGWWCKSRSETYILRTKSLDTGQEKMKILVREVWDHPILCFLFFIWAFKGLEDAHPHWWKQSALSSWIQMLISPGSSFTDILRNRVLPAMWASLSSVKLIHKTKWYAAVI